jgi:hypothetical protein
MTLQSPEQHLDREITAFLGRYAREVAGAPAAPEVAARLAARGSARAVPRTLVLPSPRLAAAIALVALAGLALGTAAFVVGQRSPDAPPLIVNGWIAFSSQPDQGEVVGSDVRRGGDIWLAGAGVEPRIIVSRGPDMDTNVCPTFSPDGTRLVYGHRSGSGSALVFLDVAPDGTVSESARVRIDDDFSDVDAPCPRWSADGTRIGTLIGSSLVIRTLDGAPLTRVPGPGDPTHEDFDGLYYFDGVYSVVPFLDRPARDLATRALVSPSGALAVRDEGGEVLVGPMDGSPGRVIASPGYGIGGWSPDSTQVLFMQDISGLDFAMHAVSIEPPFEAIEIAARIPVNGSRSWPEARDVSWQALTE